MRKMCATLGLLVTTACSGPSPVAPSTPSGPTNPAVIESCAPSVTLLSATSRDGRVQISVRNEGQCALPVGLAVYRTVYASLPATGDNLRLYSDRNVQVAAKGTGDLQVGVPPCGPFVILVYHTRTSAGTPATEGPASRFDIQEVYQVFRATDRWDAYPNCGA